VLTGYRYRLALTDVQARQCAEYGDICRAVWNTALAQRRFTENDGSWTWLREHLPAPTGVRAW